MNQLLRQKALEFRAALEAHRVDLESQLAEVQAMIEGLDKISPDSAQGDERQGDGSFRDGATEAGAPRQGNGATTGKLPAGVTKRQAVREIVSGFGSADFTVNDIMERYSDKYPQDISENLRHDISRMLRERYRSPEGDLELVKEAERPPEANVYRIRQRHDVRPEDASATEPPQASGPASNGSSDTLPVRRMVLEVLPKSGDAEFTQGTVTDAVASRWPAAANNKYLASSVANALKDMAQRGTLSRRKESNDRWAPFIYRVEHDREGRLLDP